MLAHSTKLPCVRSHTDGHTAQRACPLNTLSCTHPLTHTTMHTLTCESWARLCACHTHACLQATSPCRIMAAMCVRRTRRPRSYSQRSRATTHCHACSTGRAGAGVMGEGSGHVPYHAYSAISTLLILCTRSHAIPHARIAGKRQGGCFIRGAGILRATTIWG